MIDALGGDRLAQLLATLRRKISRRKSLNRPEICDLRANKMPILAITFTMREAEDMLCTLTSWSEAVAEYPNKARDLASQEPSSQMTTSDQPALRAAGEPTLQDQYPWGETMKRDMRGDFDEAEIDDFEPDEADESNICADCGRMFHGDEDVCGVCGAAMCFGCFEMGAGVCKGPHR